MNGPRVSDPLRVARRHVKHSRFNDALGELRRQQQVALPEWFLLEAMARWRTGNFGRSLQAADSALEQYRDLGDSDGEMRSQNVAAAGHFALGQLHEAMRGFERAAFLADERSDTLMMARCANNIGNIEHYLARNGAALRSYGKAVNLFGQVEALHGVAEAEHNRSVVRREEGDLRAAKVSSDAALHAVEALRGGRALGWVLGGRGETDAMMGDLPLGEAQVRQSLTIAASHDDILTVVDGNRILAFIARQGGDSRGAVTIAREAVVLAEEAGNPWMSAKTETELARCLEAEGLIDDAQRMWSSAGQRFDTVGARSRAEAVRHHLIS